MDGVAQPARFPFGNDVDDLVQHARTLLGIAELGNPGDFRGRAKQVDAHLPVAQQRLQPILGARGQQGLDQVEPVRRAQIIEPLFQGRRFQLAILAALARDDGSFAEVGPKFRDALLDFFDARLSDFGPRLLQFVALLAEEGGGKRLDDAHALGVVEDDDDIGPCFALEQKLKLRQQNKQRDQHQLNAQHRRGAPRLAQNGPAPAPLQLA